MEQITLEHDIEREEEKKRQFLENKDSKTVNAILGIAGTSTQKTVLKNEEASEKPLEGTIEANEREKSYNYVSFNKDGMYEEVKRRRSFILSDRKTEGVYRHKGDGSQITIKKDSVVIDNTPDNIKAALDIAEDKGWKIVKIKGGRKATQAELWFEANMRGFETTGYKPTKEDLKRLEGAKERQAQEAKEQEALDIKPQKNAEKTSKMVEDEKQAIKAESAGKDAPETEKETPAKSKNTKKKTVATQEEMLSQDEAFQRARNEIMAEVQKVMPLDEKERHELENTIDQQLAYASRTGKVKVKGATETIRKTLPIARQELEHAAQAEKAAEKAKPQTKQRTNIAVNTKELTNRKDEQVKSKPAERSR